jgi:hypothetical protein
MVKHKSIFVAVILAVSAFAVSAASGQSKTYEFGGSLGAVIPTTNFQNTAGPGISGSVFAGRWNSDHVLLFMVAGYDQFSEQTLDDGAKRTGAFLPVELGFRFHSAGGGVKGMYFSAAGGVMFSQGDFDGRKASLSLGLGYSFPSTGKRLLLDARYRSEISDPFNSYLNIGLTIGFGSGNK